MKTEKLKDLWGEELFNVFANHIDEDGCLTESWAEIIENEIPKFDDDYNDNPLYRETYSRMYNMEFEEIGNKIRPQTEITLKCFRIYSDEFEYLVAAYNGTQALSFLKNEHEVNAKKILEVPESEWNEKIIKIWEDNDFSKKPFKVSIRESIIGDDIQMLSSTDFSLIQ